MHFYDEPGLTWTPDPRTGEPTPHTVPWQLRQYEAAFGRPMLDWKTVDPANPEQTARWAEWARWKLGFLDAAWQDAQFGVREVEPGLRLPDTEPYGYSAFSDGYYFNVARSLPVTSGHGGYHDFGPGYFNPVLFLEMARARDFAKPNWYLPTWFGGTTADQFRLKQYLCFQCGLQGLMSPARNDPGNTPEKPPAAQGVVESNHLLQRLVPSSTPCPLPVPPWRCSSPFHSSFMRRPRSQGLLRARHAPRAQCALRLSGRQNSPAPLYAIAGRGGPRWHARKLRLMIFVQRAQSHESATAKL